MVALNSDFVASKPDTDSKNRVERFFSLASEIVGKDRRSSRKYAGEKQVYRYDIAPVDTEFEYGPFGELIRANGSKKDDFNFRFYATMPNREFLELNGLDWLVARSKEIIWCYVPNVCHEDSTKLKLERRRDES